MLPNWLLGKSKSKLQEILGGGGGGTSYTAGDGIDISNNVISFNPLTTPAIDPSKIDGLDDDLAALAPKTALSNPNILHNPWFQVNQRQATTISSSDAFIVDRWKTNIFSVASGTFAVNSDGTITIASTSSTISMYQKRTAKTFARLKGRKVTLSVMLADGTVYSGTGVVPSSGVIHVFENDDISLGLDETENKIFMLHVFGGKTVTIKALKLEVGEISTLAMDTAPDMAVELAKCQRYFIRFKNDTSYNRHLTLGCAYTASQLYFDLTLPSQMRTTPTFSASSIRVEKAGGSSVTGTPSISLFSIMNNITRLSVTGLSSLTTGSLYSLMLTSNAYLDFSAEL